MSPASKSSMLRFRGGSAILLICLSLPVTDRFSEQVGAEMAALWVFVFLFLVWIAVGLVMDAWSRPRDSDGAERRYAAKSGQPSQT